ncbi:MAG: flippase, partial [Candidatus Doudnabacteria bacterium]|nr:flippase [Candidatus Doudnabacteria bacterium]
MLHIGRNILSLITSRVLSAIILLFVYFRLPEYLGPDAMGKFGLQSSYLIVFAFFVDLGMQQLVIKKVSESRAEAGKYLSNYFGIQFLFGLLFASIMTAIILAANYPPLVRQALLVTAVGLFLSSMTMPFMSVINAFERFKIIAAVNFVNTMINASMIILTIVMRRNILFLAFIPVVVSSFDILVYAYIVRKKFAQLSFRFDFDFWKMLFIWNLPFIPLTIFSIYNRVDTLLLPHLRNFTETGYYTVAYKFWDLLAFIPGAVGAVLYPYFAGRLFRGEHQEARKVVEIYTRFMIALGVALTVGAYLLADRLLLTLLRTNEFAPAAPALWILVAAVSLLMIYSPVNSIIISQRTKTATIITGITLIFNLTANIVLVPKYGFVMAAIITFFSELLQLVGYTYIVKTKVIDFKYFSSFTKPLIAGLLMGGVVYYLRDLNLIILLPIGG